MINSKDFSFLDLEQVDLDSNSKKEELIEDRNLLDINIISRINKLLRGYNKVLE